MWVLHLSHILQYLLSSALIIWVVFQSLPIDSHDPGQATTLAQCHILPPRAKGQLQDHIPGQKGPSGQTPRVCIFLPFPIRASRLKQQHRILVCLPLQHPSGLLMNCVNSLFWSTGLFEPADHKRRLFQAKGYKHKDDDPSSTYAWDLHRYSQHKSKSVHQEVMTCHVGP